jgi:hypothetical protein
MWDSSAEFGAGLMPLSEAFVSPSFGGDFVLKLPSFNQANALFVPLETTLDSGQILDGPSCALFS